MSSLVSLRCRLCALALLGAVACSSASSGAPAAGPTLTPNADGWWRDKVIYEVFVRSFADSNGDGKGDLKGLTAKLDYLRDGNAASASSLNVDAIWLMPIHPSPSYHGYDVTDYKGVNPDYGTEADFDALVAAAHQRGLKVVLDLVMNHSSSQHPWFQDSMTGPSAAKRDWYVWQPTVPSWGGSLWHERNGAFYYAYFWSEMPDLNLRNPAVVAAVEDAMRFWLAKGVDGFRFDAARYFIESLDGHISDQPETHALVKQLRADLQRDFPQTLFVAEAWTSEDTVLTYAGDGDEFSLAFSFDQALAMQSAIASGARGELVNTIATTETLFAGKDRGFEAPFLANHDMKRILRLLGGDAAGARLAAAVLLALPGTPFLYYGEELGMQGEPSGDDPSKRTPLRWSATPPGYGFTTNGPGWYGPTTEAPGVDVASEQAEPKSLWHLYRKLIALRHAQPALAKGEATRPKVSIPKGPFALLRTGADHTRVLFVGNFATRTTGPFTVAVDGAPSTLFAEGLDAPATSAAGALTIPNLQPRGFVYLSLD